MLAITTALASSRCLLAPGRFTIEERLIARCPWKSCLDPVDGLGTIGRIDTFGIVVDKINEFHLTFILVPLSSADGIRLYGLVAPCQRHFDIS